MLGSPFVKVRILLRVRPKSLIERKLFFVVFFLKMLRLTLGAQLVTSLKADLCQDISGCFAFSRHLNGTFPGRNCSVKTLEH